MKCVDADSLVKALIEARDKEAAEVCDVGEDRCITNPNGYCYWAKEAIRIDADLQGQTA